jgi:hypothetical protein
MNHFNVSENKLIDKIMPVIGKILNDVEIPGGTGSLQSELQCRGSYQAACSFVSVHLRCNPEVILEPFKVSLRNNGLANLIKGEHNVVNNIPNVHHAPINALENFLESDVNALMSEDFKRFDQGVKWSINELKGNFVIFFSLRENRLSFVEHALSAGLKMMSSDFYQECDGEQFLESITFSVSRFIEMISQYDDLKENGIRLKNLLNYEREKETKTNLDNLQKTSELFVCLENAFSQDKMKPYKNKVNITEIAKVLSSQECNDKQSIDLINLVPNGWSQVPGLNLTQQFALTYAFSDQI